MRKKISCYTLLPFHFNAHTIQIHTIPYRTQDLTSSFKSFVASLQAAPQPKQEDPPLFSLDAMENLLMVWQGMVWHCILQSVLSLLCVCCMILFMIPLLCIVIKFTLSDLVYRTDSLTRSHCSEFQIRPRAYAVSRPQPIPVSQHILSCNHLIIYSRARSYYCG